MDPAYFSTRVNPTLNNYASNIEVIENPQFTDPVEIDWLKNKISINEKEYDLSYPEPYFIKPGYIEKICTIIGTKTGIYKRRNLNDTGRKGGDVQDELHRCLSSELYAPKENSRRFNLSRTHINYLFQQAHSSVDFIFANDQVKRETEHEILNFLKQSLNSSTSISHELFTSEENISALQLTEIFWRGGIPSAFFETGHFWKCYERVSLDKKEWPEYGPKHGFMINGFCIYPMASGEANCLMVNTSINSENEREQGRYFGPAAVAGTRNPYLHLYLQQKNTPFPEYFVLKLDDPAKQKIMIGHYISYSENLRKYITKMVVLEKLSKEDQTKFNFTTAADLDLALKKLSEYAREITYNMSVEEIETVPKPIRAFLADRRLNRLSMPFEPINFLGQLEKWMDEKHKFIKDTQLGVLCKQFVVVYCYDENELGQTIDNLDWMKVRLDAMEITIDESELRYNVDYIHRAEGKASKYSGNVFIKTGNIELLIYQSNEEDLKAVDRNYGLLNFSIPQIDVITAESHFIGILSGLGDKPVTPVSYRVIIFMREAFLKSPTKEISHDNINDTCKSQIVDFFNKNAANLYIKTIQ